MNRRSFLKLAGVTAGTLVTGSCGYLRIDPYHYLIRSPYITSEEQEREIMSRAKLLWSDDGRVRIVIVKGTPYEMGYQQGRLLEKEIQDNMGYLYEQAKSKFHSAELFAEVYERMRPFIPQTYIDEMHGLAHGARIDLSVVHAIHVLPDMGEWGGKKGIKKAIDKMMKGELATMCSNFATGKSATKNAEFYSVRLLDWGLHRVSKLHKYPLITVGIPNDGVPYANCGWVGFLGAVSGMNAEKITLGEMGYGDPAGETLAGTPMCFLLREILQRARNLGDVRRIIKDTPPTNSYVFLMTDGKTQESQMYVRDPSRFVVFEPGTEITDHKEHMPAIADTVYGGKYTDRMTNLLSANHGQVTPEIIMNEIIPKIAMKSNFQNVIYKPTELKLWLNNAKSKTEWAASQPYTHFDLGALLKREGVLN
jgi:hypothetical protein